MLRSTPTTCAKRGIYKDLGVKPELESSIPALWFVKQMVKEGLYHRAVTDSAVHGNPYGVPATSGICSPWSILCRELQLGQLAISPCRCLGGAGGAARRQRARRSGGQSLFEQGVPYQQHWWWRKARTIIEALGARVLSPARARTAASLSAP